ncbi:hypothetical protein AAFX91_13305 [Bradyrhizobium sp. 31Argb]|uniref:hypothetical protein n=1 Tax=Bradyrhizobium sp. 31Argb TaxID=3141247 RepID=UPI00374A6A4B
MSMMIRTAFSFVALLAVVQPAMACRHVQWHTNTLLDSLPAGARGEPVIARVEPIQLLRPPWVNGDDWTSTPLIRVRVIEAIKGVQEGQTFVVDSRGTSCDQAFPRNDPRFQAYMINWRPYIVGRFESSNSGEVFRGAWRRDLATGELLFAP